MTRAKNLTQRAGWSGLCLAVFLTAAGAWAAARPPDADKVEAFADALLGDRFRVAVVATGPFGEPAEDPEFFQLRSGVSLLDEAGEGMAVPATFQAYRVLAGLKGNLDDWIFVRMARGTSRFPEFLPPEETQWVVALREVLDGDGRPLWHDSRLYPGDTAAAPYLTRDNLFMVHRGRVGAVGVGGPEDRRPGATVHPLELADDVRTIWAALEGGEEPDGLLAEGRLSTEFGRAVAAEIAERRRPLTPAQRIERDLRDMLRAVEWREISYADYRTRRAEYEAQEWVSAERERQREERLRVQAIEQAHAQYERGEMSREDYEAAMQEWRVPPEEWRSPR